jgi:hypothetical protein
MDIETEIVRDILAEPVNSWADFVIKLRAWELSIRSDEDDDGDMSYPDGGVDRALPRLFNDARALLSL